MLRSLRWYVLLHTNKSPSENSHYNTVSKIHPGDQVSQLGGIQIRELPRCLSSAHGLPCSPNDLIAVAHPLRRYPAVVSPGGTVKVAVPTCPKTAEACEPPRDAIPPPAAALHRRTPPSIASPSSPSLNDFTKPSLVNLLKRTNLKTFYMHCTKTQKYHKGSITF